MKIKLIFLLFVIFPISITALKYHVPGHSELCVFSDIIDGSYFGVELLICHGGNYTVDFYISDPNGATILNETINSKLNPSTHELMDSITPSYFDKYAYIDGTYKFCFFNFHNDSLHADFDFYSQGEKEDKDINIKQEEQLPINSYNLAAMNTTLDYIQQNLIDLNEASKSYVLLASHFHNVTHYRKMQIQAFNAIEMFSYAIVAFLQICIVKTWFAKFRLPIIE